MCSLFNANSCAVVVSCYSPTNAIDESDIGIFYKEQSYRAPYIPKQNVLNIGGDMNAQIGKDENYNFCFYNLPKKMAITQQIFHSRTVFLALTINSKKRWENYGPTLTQITLKQDLIIFSWTRSR